MFNIRNDTPYFDLKYTKISKKNEVFFLYYKMDEQEPMTIKIQGPNNYDELFNTNKKEGYINFIFNKGGSYKIIFKFERRYLNNNIDNNENVVSFKIVSSEYPFKIDISKDISFEEISFNGIERTSLKLYTDILTQNYIKKIKIENVFCNEINDIISINNNGTEFKNLSFNYYLFENNSYYNINVNFNDKEENKYILKKFSIKDFETKNIQNFSLGNITYNDSNDKFLIINWNNYYRNIIINNKDNNEVKFYISMLNESQINDLVKEFQNIQLKEVKNNIIEKPENYKYEVLFIEINENEVQLNFEEEKEKKDNNKNKISIYVILAIIFGIILLIIIIMLIIRYYRKKNLSTKINTLSVENETLLKEY